MIRSVLHVLQDGTAKMQAKRWPLIVWFLAATSVAANFIATRSGAGLTPDATEYISAARHFAQGDGYSDFTASAVVHWPPGYSGLLALGDLVAIDPYTGARLVNAVAFGAIVLLASVLLRRLVRSPLVSILALLVIAWSQPLLAASSYALSEAVFSLQVLAFLSVLENALDGTDRRWLWILTAAVIAGSAYLVRYAGLSLIAVGFLTLALSRHGKPRQRLTEGAGYVLAASVLPGLWSLRNIRAAGSISESGSPSGDTPLDLIQGLADGASALFLPERIPLVVRELALVAVVFIVLAGWVASTRAPRAARARATRSLLPLTSFLLVYPAFLVASRLATGADPPTARFLVPALAPLIILAAWGVEGLPALILRIKPGLVVLLTASVFVYVLGVAGWFWAYSIHAGRGPRGYERARWKESQLIDQVSRLLPQHTRQIVYSNQPNPIYWVTGREPVRYFEERDATEQGIAPSSTELVQQLEEDAACDRGSFLAWFGVDSPRSHMTGELARGARLTLIERAADGTLYEVRLHHDSELTALDRPHPRCN